MAGKDCGSCGGGGEEECAAEVCRNSNRISGGGDMCHSRLSSSSSSSSSSYLSLSPADKHGGGECGLVGEELEAARALTCISRTAVEGEDGDGRRRKRVKEGSPASNWPEESIQGGDLGSVSKNMCFEDDTPQENDAINITLEEKVKVDQNCEISPSNGDCTATHLSCSGRRMRQNLTEAEREAKKMRRVLANRESARQTIRRRQALRDGLTKKVNDLSLDNQNMKMEKERVMTEYISLKNKNKQLKYEMASAISCNIKKEKVASAPPESYTSSSDHSLPAGIRPHFIPWVWPPWHVIASQAGLFCDNSDPHKISGPQTQLHLPSCAWFCSLFHQMSESYNAMSDKWKVEERDIIPKCSKAAVAGEENHAVDLEKEKAEDGKSCKLDIDLNSKCVMVELEKNDVDENFVDKLPLEAEEVPGQIHHCAKMLDASVAAAARRRRKEIIKLKHSCGKPIGLQS